MIVYFNNQFAPTGNSAVIPEDSKYFIPKDDVKISPDDRGFTFGDGIYEVLKVYKGKMFAVEAHLKRLENSLKGIQLPLFDSASVVPLMRKLLESNNLAASNAKIYLQVTRGTAPRDHAFPGNGCPITIFMSVDALPEVNSKLETGVKAISTVDNRWLHCDIKQIGLLAGVLAKQKAKSSGAYEAVFLRDGIVTEGTHSNFAAIVDGELYTHPANNMVLPGVTRMVVLELCRELNIPINEKPFSFEWLKEKLADDTVPVECILLGTITEVMPLVQIDGTQVGDGKPGELTKRLQKAFFTRTGS